MWQRSTKERRGDGSYLVLNGQCLGAAVNAVWCLLLCLVTGRGGVEVVSIRDADVQFSQCSGQGNQAGGGRREGFGARGHREGGSQARTLSRGSGSGRCTPPVQDWHSVSESVREGLGDQVQSMSSLGRSIIEAGEHHGERARDHYGTPSIDKEGKI